jgi:hypothetical protein
MSPSPSPDGNAGTPAPRRLLPERPSLEHSESKPKICCATHAAATRAPLRASRRSGAAHLTAGREQ